MASQAFSLLWSSDTRDTFSLEEIAIENLNINEILNANNKKGKALTKYLKEVPRCIEDIHYRQGVLEELVDNRLLLEAIKTCVGKCNSIYKRVNFTIEKEANVFNLIYLVDSVNQVMETVENLHSILIQMKVKAKGLLKYKEVIEAGVNHPLYKSFKKDVIKIKAISSDIEGFKVGINLDDYLRPSSAVLLSFQDKAFKIKGFKRPNYRFQFNPNDLATIDNNLHKSIVKSRSNPLGNIEALLHPALQQLIIFCEHFIETILSMHSALYEEIDFYEFGIHIYDTLKDGGFYVCQPLIFDQGKTIIDSAYNANLAYKMLKSLLSENEIVYNTYTTNQEGNIYVLTGANRGGKTTYTQAIGQIFWFAQLGFYVPAKKAALKIVDGIFLHFPSQEEPANALGRFGNECNYFASIYKQLTANSILLMNESFSGTSHLESLTIAFEAVKALQEVGSTTIFNTHLHELGRMIEGLNIGEDKKTKCVSLVTGNAEHLPYYVYEGEPLGQSYAQDIAIRYGLTFEQLIRDDKLRKVVLAATHG